MKRFIAVLSGLLVLPAFAEVAPVYYDESIEYTDDMANVEETENVDEYATEKPTVKNVSQRNTINRSTSASRTISSGNAGVSTRSNTTTRAMASSPRSTTKTSRGTTARTAKTSNVVSRTPTNSRATVRSRNTQNVSKPTTARVGTNNSIMPAYKGTTRTVSSELQDSGSSLYNPNTVRVGVTNRRSSARVSTAVKTPVVTEEDVLSTTNNLDAIAELTDYCKAQYAACMDNYCNVLDDNQGRCSCSKNLKNYEKTEAALTAATENFQDVVQKIKYIGLTGDQIKTLFTETEAELAMKSNSDSSRLKTSLDTIRKGISDVSTSSSSSVSVTGDLSFDITGLLNADLTAGFDWSSFLNGSGNNTNNVSNQRGDTLYKTATNRCKTAVLSSCTAQGIDANVITNSYDLEIDKQCAAYERSLNEANSEMRANVKNAQYILQQARLLLAQNRNSYDLRSCVAAIDSCMQDDYVCGSDYELCLDPTGKYLANGEIVKGGTPGVSGGQTKNTLPITETATTYTNGSGSVTTQTLNDWTSQGMYNLYSIWNYGTGNNSKNAWGAGQTENLGEYVEEALSTWKSNYKNANLNNNVATYLLQKVGYIDSDDKVHGMCASVMKQCQDYTFNDQASSNKKYIFDNEVVRQYLNSTLAKIKVQQDAILADYAEGCRSDVQSCLSTNGYDESNTASTASKTAVNACAAEITTCMSVGGYQVQDGIRLTLRAMSDWVESILISCPVDTYLFDNGTSVECKSCGYPEIVDSTGTAVTQSICAADTTNVQEWTSDKCRTVEKATSAGGQATICSCPEGFDDYIKQDNDGIRTLYCKKQQ